MARTTAVGLLLGAVLLAGCGSSDPGALAPREPVTANHDPSGDAAVGMGGMDSGASADSAIPSSGDGGDSALDDGSVLGDGGDSGDGACHGSYGPCTLIAQGKLCLVGQEVLCPLATQPPACADCVAAANGSQGGYCCPP